MKKRMIAFFCAAALLLGLVPIGVLADGNGISVVIGGEARVILKGSTLGDLMEDSDAVLLYATIEEEGRVTHVNDLDLVLQSGMAITLHTLRLQTERNAQLRRVNPTGLRFATMLNKEGFASLLENPDIASISLGTLILPANTAVMPISLTHAGMGETLHLDVAATPGQWQADSEKDHIFAGSIIDLKPQNYSREFAGCGYLRATLKSGESFTAYSEVVAVGAFGIMAAEWAAIADNGISGAERAYFSHLARVMYTADLKGLDVLAIGDSLFDGDFLSGKRQWIGRLSGECDWFFTNLGHDGWTVAYNPDAYPEGASVRQSMYDHLFNDPDYCHGNGSASYLDNRPYARTPEDVDMILLEGGANDFGWNIPYGTVDSRDPGTFLGAMNLMIEKLLADYPNATLVLVTSWHVPAVRDDGADRLDFMANGMKEIYETYYQDHARVTLIDAGDPSVTGIDMASLVFRRVYAKNERDVYHLNEAGMKKMAEAMLPLLWEAFTNY